MYIFFIDLLIAVVLDWIIGDPRWFPHPVIYIGKLIKFLENTFRKLAKNDNELKIYGGFIVLIVSSISFFIVYIILKLLRNYAILYHVVNVIFLWTTIACKCLKDEALKVYYELKKGDIKEARVKLSYIVGRETQFLSEKEIIRADVETVAENTSDGVIAPLFFAMLGGAPLAMMYKAINTMDSMLGYLTKEYKYIGFFPAKVDDVFNFIPARITGFLICLVSPFVGGNIKYSFKIMRRDRKNHKSPNCAYPEAATAGALKIQLGGTNVYFGEIISKPTIGDDINELSSEDIFKTIKLMYYSEILIIIFYVLICFIVISLAAIYILKNLNLIY